MEFNDMLKKLRKEKKVTQEELATALNYGPSAISNYESGKNEPSISDLIKIADFFNVTPGYLMGAEEFNTKLLDPKKLNTLKNEIEILLKHTKKLSETLESFLK